MFLARIAVALVPGLAWLFFLGWLGRREPGFRGTMLKVFALGMTICIPAGYFNTFLQLSLFGGEPGGSLQSLLLFLVVVGPVEEGLKFLILYSEVYRRWQVRTPRDGVLLSTASAIGFATYENAHYAEMFGAEVLTLRGWACVMAHVGFSALFGHYLGLAKSRRYSERACLAEGLALAAAMHGLYDYSVGLRDWALYPFIGLMTAIYVALRRFDLRPLSVRLVPSLARQGPGKADLSSFLPVRFPDARGQERLLADAAIESMESDEEARRLEGLDAARGRSDQRLFEQVQRLTHDPDDAVRRAAQAITAEMKGRAKPR